MTNERKTEIIERTLNYLLNSDASDDLLFKILHDHIGMSKEELNSFSIGWRMKQGVSTKRI